jgi:hypothetical protein
MSGMGSSRQFAAADGDAALLWHEPVWLPTRPLQDPRVKPGHISLLSALHRLTAADRSGEREWHEFGDELHALPFTEAVVLRYARFGDEALVRYRRDLQRWGYIRYETRPGRASLYDIVTISDDMGTGEFLPVPAMVCDDLSLRPGHIAAYVALAHAAEERRLRELPDIGDLDGWEFPAYGYRCALRGRDLDRAAGFRHSTTRNQYLVELVQTGHISVEKKGHQYQSIRYRLLTNQAADQAQRDAYRQQHEQWEQQQMSGERDHQTEGAT